HSASLCLVSLGGSHENEEDVCCNFICNCCLGSRAGGRRRSWRQFLDTWVFRQPCRHAVATGLVGYRRLLSRPCLRWWQRWALEGNRARPHTCQPLLDRELQHKCQRESWLDGRNLHF